MTSWGRFLNKTEFPQKLKESACVMTEYELFSYHKNLLQIYNSSIHIYFPIVDLFENLHLNGTKLKINSEIKPPLYVIYIKQKVSP